MCVARVWMHHILIIDSFIVGLEKISDDRKLNMHKCLTLKKHNATIISYLVLLRCRIWGLRNKLIALALKENNSNYMIRD